MWQPAVNVFDERQVKDNLIAYFQANQADALAWANEGNNLQAIKDFHRSPRLVSVFPALTFIQTNHRSTFDDVLGIDLEILFEAALVNGNQDVLSDISSKYSMALESMLSNMPETTFNEGSIINTKAYLVSLNTVFDVQGKFKSQFIQVFQTLALWRVEASAFDYN